MARKKQTYLWQRRRKRLARRLRLLLVPVRDNHYRPHLVRRYGLLAVMLLVVGLQFGYNYSHTGHVLGRTTTVTPSALLSLTNDVRSQHDLVALTPSPELAAAARYKAQDILDRQYWDHTAPDGTEPWYWVEMAGYDYAAAGENLARNFTTASAAMTAWMQSDPHRDNILRDVYRDVGFAIVDGQLDGRASTVIVALYGEPAAAVAGAQTVVGPEARTVPQTAQPLSIAARIGVSLQELTPAALTSLALLFIAITVAITAHIYRGKLPRNRRESWYRHHGGIKATGLLAIAAFIVLIYGGGQV